MPSSSSSSDSDYDALEGHSKSISGKFMIISKLNGKAVDIKRSRKRGGASVIMYDVKHSKNANQLWYSDNNGFIRSSINDMVFRADAEGDPLKTSKDSDDPRGRWRVHGDRIINGLGQCLDIKQANTANKAQLCAYKPTGGLNQAWNIVHHH